VNTHLEVVGSCIGAILAEGVATLDEIFIQCPASEVDVVKPGTKDLGTAYFEVHSGFSKFTLAAPKPRGGRRLSVTFTKSASLTMLPTTANQESLEAQLKSAGCSVEAKLDILLGALKSAGSSEDEAFFVSWLLACLTELSTGNADVRTYIKEQEGCGLILLAQDNFHESIHVQWQAMQLIGRLSATAEIADLFGFNAISKIHDCMEDCLEDSFGEFALTGISSIANLLANSATAKQEARKSNYAQSLHTLMDKHPTGFANFNFKAHQVLSEVLAEKKRTGRRLSITFTNSSSIADLPVTSNQTILEGKLKGSTSEAKLALVLGALKSTMAEEAKPAADEAYYVSWLLACVMELSTDEAMRKYVKENQGCTFVLAAQDKFHESIHVQWQAMQLIGRLSATEEIANMFGYDAVKRIYACMDDCLEDSFGEFALTGISSISNILNNSGATKDTACAEDFATSLKALIAKHNAGFSNFKFKAQAVVDTLTVAMPPPAPREAPPALGATTSRIVDANGNTRVVTIASGNVASDRNTPRSGQRRKEADNLVSSNLSTKPATAGPGTGDIKDTADFKYEKYDTLPTFTDKHKSLMSKLVTSELFEKMKGLKTAKGYTLSNCIQTGVKTPHLGVGITAGDEESWVLFKDVMYPIIKGWHGYDPEVDTHKVDLDPSKVVFTDEQVAKFDKYVASTRIRAARNVSGFSLPAGTTAEDRSGVESVLTNAFAAFEGELTGKYYPLEGMSDTDRDFLLSNGFLFQIPKETNLLWHAGAARD